MIRYFGDTSCFIGLIVEEDHAHQIATEATKQLNGDVLTTEWVLLEMGNYFGGSKYRSAFSQFASSIKNGRSVQVLKGDTTDFNEGLELYRRRVDNQWSLTDCISMTISTRYQIQDELTTDRHFTQAGFNALLIP